MVGHIGNYDANGQPYLTGAGVTESEKTFDIFQDIGLFHVLN